MEQRLLLPQGSHDQRLDEGVTDSDNDATAGFIILLLFNRLSDSMAL